MLISIISDSELVFRAIYENSQDSTFYSLDDDGNIQIDPSAFRDREELPSVDRSILNGFQPCKSAKRDENGVIGLWCSDIRKITTIHGDDCYSIDVIPRPEQNNISHAQIEPDPEYKKKKRIFRKVRIALARLATQSLKDNGWLIFPSELRD